jgi:predicted AlkP superfamily pyrophosphatase or phosphodiesterase
MRPNFPALCLLSPVIAFWGPAIRPVSAADDPRLVVIVCVDQLAGDYLIRFADNFAEDGLFRRTFRDDASYRHCRHRHAFTYTAPGHAVLLTGTYPCRHGIIANEWFDRERQELRYCVRDPEATVIGVASEKGMSPRSLLTTTVGNQLKLVTVGKAKVFGLAVKERAAILLAGHSADAAFWLDRDCWVTSDYYRPELPGYLRELNAAGTLNRQYRGRTWDLLLPRGKYHNSGPDENAWERPPPGFTTSFPHALLKAGEGTAKEFSEQVLNSPFGNDYTLQAARELIRHEKLGIRDVPDMLCISLSSNDYVGHAFGPYSLEVEDLTYRTDRELGAFARFVDEQVGAGRWTLILTADHGIAPIVGYAQQPGLRLPAVHDPLPVQKVRVELEAELRRQLGVPAEAAALIQEVEEFQVHLNLQHPALVGGQLVRARQIARDWVTRQPHVALARSQEDLLTGDGDELHQAL